jgi:hypothetical protein
MSIQLKNGMVRRQKAGVMRLIAISLCCMTYVNACCAATGPNFVVFYVDDLGWADTSVRMIDDEPLSKSDFNQTPALERLARQGVRFTSGYAPTPTCTGSRISIQFGKTTTCRKHLGMAKTKIRSSNAWGWTSKETSSLRIINPENHSARLQKRNTRL